MYRILLVDDEVMELEALKNYIDWKKLGIEHVVIRQIKRCPFRQIISC